MNPQTIITIDGALAQGRAKHRKPDNVLHALTRWLGGLVWAYMKSDANTIRGRAAVCAALCVRVLEEGDPTLDKHRKDRGLDTYAP